MFFEMRIPTVKDADFSNTENHFGKKSKTLADMIKDDGAISGDESSRDKAKSHLVNPQSMTP